MGDLTRDFSRAEFACPCGCGFDTVDWELLFVLQHLRNFYHREITITGPNRCREHNAQVGGAENSMHIQGKAADFKIYDVSPKEVYDYLELKFHDQYGVGLYSNRIHLDVRPNRARWRVNK